VPDVAQEYITTPSTNPHDRVDRDVVQIHGHGCTAVDGVETSLILPKAQDVLANCCNDGSYLSQDGLGSEHSHFPHYEDGIHLCIVGRIWVGLDVLDKGSPPPDTVQ
jgi:hypothetical protein